MYQLIYSLLPVILLSLIVLSLTVFVFIQSEGKNLLKMLLIPMAIFSGIAAPVIFITLMGYSVFVELPEKFTVIAHNVIIEDGKKKYIEIWTRFGYTSRLYILHYNKEMEKQLEESGKGNKKGKVTLFTKKPLGLNESLDKSQFSTEMAEKYELPRKDPI